MNNDTSIDWLLAHCFQFEFQLRIGFCIRCSKEYVDVYISMNGLQGLEDEWAQHTHC